MKFDIVELFKDIGIKIIDEKPELSILKDLTIIGVESCCPKIAPAINAGNVIITRLEDYKLKYLLYGLSNGKNVEMHINMLRNYVMSSSERAYRVADVFKKTVVSESLNSCILLGAELAKKLKDDTDYTIDELIVCKALENAIDYDLKCFKELMTNCVYNEHY